MHPRVVGDADDHAAVDARIGGCKKRVRRDVQTDMLHRAEGTRAANGRAERGLARDLLIRRPFRINFLILARIFGNFSRRRSRIARHKPASRLKKSPGNCLIAQHQLFHLTPLSGFFEKKPRQKTLVGCAANSKAGAAFTQVAPRTERPTLRSQKLCVFLPQVDNALGLAGKPLDRLWLDERDLCVDAEYRA